MNGVMISAAFAGPVPCEVVIVQFNDFPNTISTLIYTEDGYLFYHGTTHGYRLHPTT